MPNVGSSELVRECARLLKDASQSFKLGGARGWFQAIAILALYAPFGAIKAFWLATVARQDQSHISVISYRLVSRAAQVVVLVVTRGKQIVSTEHSPVF